VDLLLGTETRGLGTTQRASALADAGMEEGIPRVQGIKTERVEAFGGILKLQENTAWLGGKRVVHSWRLISMLEIRLQGSLGDGEYHDYMQN